MTQLLETALGPELVSWLQDENTLEILLNSDGSIWLDDLTRGKYRAPVTLNTAQAEAIIKLIAAQKHCVINREHPELSCELYDYAVRFQAFWPPIVEKPIFSMRKHRIQARQLKDYVQDGTLSETYYTQLINAITQKKNILIAGSTGSGKTTFANALLSELDKTNERLVILEDLPEIKINHPDHVKLCTSDTLTMRDLVKGALRLRPDRIIIGEVRDGAALDMLKAWNTGHPGGICTLHANSADNALYRLESLIQEVLPTVPEALIQHTIDCVVFMTRNIDGKHCIVEVKTID